MSPVSCYQTEQQKINSEQQQQQQELQTNNNLHFMLGFVIGLFCHLRLISVLLWVCLFYSLGFTTASSKPFDVL